MMVLFFGVGDVGMQGKNTIIGRLLSWLGSQPETSTRNGVETITVYLLIEDLYTYPKPTC